MSPASNTLRRLLAPGQPTVAAPGCYDALTASLIERAGFSAAYLSGAAVSYSRLGAPDIGLISAAEVAETIALISERTPDLPLIVDADTGFGNVLNVQRTVTTFERAGAAAIQLEDQMAPKRCGHLAGRQLISKSEMVGKIKAAVDARRDGVLVMARTDAIAVEGLEAALDRAEAYVEAGADMLFIEAPRSLEQMALIGRTFGSRLPLLANIVNGGDTPEITVAQVEAMGFSLAIFPGALIRLFMAVAENFLPDLKRDGSTQAWADRMYDFKALNARLETADWLARGDRYAAD